MSLHFWNGLGVLLLGCIFITGALGLFHYVGGRKNPFRDVVLAAGVKALAVGVFFVISSWPVFRETSLATVAPRAFALLVWSAVVAAGAAVTLFSRRFDDINLWNSEIAAIKERIETKQDEILTRLERVEALSKEHRE